MTPSQAVPHDDRSQARPGRGKSLLWSWGPTILFSVLLPFITYAVLTDRGVPPALALMLIAVWPLVELGVFFAIHRRIDEFGVLVLVFFGIGLLSMVAFNSPVLLLVKESAVTGLFGLVLLVSLLLPRPVMFYFGRKFGTDGSAEGVAHWNQLWRHPGFRRTQRVITLVWGVAFFAEALVRIGLAMIVPVPVMVVITNALPVAVIAILAGWTVAYGKRARAAAGQPAVTGNIGSDG